MCTFFSGDDDGGFSVVVVIMIGESVVLCL